MADLEPEMTLRDYAAVVSRRKWVIIAAVVVTTIVGLLSSVVQTPIYAADAEVLIQPRGEDGLFEERVDSVNDRAIQTEIQVVEGQAVRARVQEDLGLDAPPEPVDASSIGDTDVIQLTTRNTNASNAATLANAYAEAYIDVRREQSVDDLLAASAEVQTAIDDLQAQIDDLDEDDPQRATLVAQQANFATTLDQLRVDARLRTGGATVIKQAEVPEEPVEPTPVRTATLAFVVGLLLGLGAAFLIEYLDDKVRRRSDLESITSHVILADVPVDSPPDQRPLALSDPSRTSVESYRGLRTNVQFLALDQEITVVQVTSSLAGEGKTTTATNLAVVLARAGHLVALVDADLRRPRVHEAFGLSPAPGLTDVLLGASPKDVVESVDVGATQPLAVYTSGEVPSNPSEMLGGRRMKLVLDKMGEHYDFVVVDSAPILPVSDSVAIAGFADAVIVVVQAAHVKKNDVAATLERLERVSAPICGLVLNQARSSGPETYAYAYGGYGPRPSSRSAPATSNTTTDWTPPEAEAIEMEEFLDVPTGSDGGPARSDL